MGTQPKWVQTPDVDVSIVCYFVSTGAEECTQHDEPLRLLDSVGIRLGVTESLPLGVLGLLDLVGGTVSDEDGLSSPLDDDVLALGDGGGVAVVAGATEGRGVALGGGGAGTSIADLEGGNRRADGRGAGALASQRGCRRD